MLLRSSLPYINLLLTLGLCIYFFSSTRDGKSGYILNDVVFEKFKGKQELEKKLHTLKAKNKLVTDSLVNLLRSAKDVKLAEHYQATLQHIAQEEDQISATYTADIWKRINQGVLEYGQEYHYAFIFGASGNGGLMYANESYNLTDEIVSHINNKYEGQ